MGIFDRIFKKPQHDSDSLDFNSYIYNDKSNFFQSNKDTFFQNNNIRYLKYSVHREIGLDYENKKEIEYGHMSPPFETFDGESGYNYGNLIYEKEFGSINNSNLFEVFNNLDNLRMIYYPGHLKFLTLENYDEYYSKYDNLSEKDKLFSICINRVVILGCEYWKFDLWWNDMKKLWRIKFDINKEGVSDKELKEFYVKYEPELHRLTNNRNYPEDKRLLSSISKGGELRCYNEHSRVRDDIIEYSDKIRTKNYDKEKYTWKNIDVSKEFKYVMNRMLVTITDLPPDIWRISRSYPFFRIYRVLRDYMFYRKSFSVVKEMFKYIVEWEKGELLDQNSQGFEKQKPMWIKWNIIWKDFFNCGKFLIFEDDGLEWLKNTVGKYLKDRQEYYNGLCGPKSEYYISDSSIYKFFNGIEIFTVQWKSEFELTLLVKQHIEQYNVEVKPHCRPHWLTPQELDIYFEIGDKKVGIEYQGEQHYNSIDYFGGEEGLRDTKKRDNKKKRLCKKNNVILIYYKYDEKINYDVLKNKFKKHDIEI